MVCISLILVFTVSFRSIPIDLPNSGDGGGEDKVQDKDRPKFRPESKLGKHPTVSSFDPNVGKVIDQALSKVDRRGKVAVSSSGSEEMKDTSKVSPVRAFKGYPK